MAKKAYIGIDGVARKAKKIYLGINNKARKVKKGYIGIGGVARPFWPSLEGVEYYGQITPLSKARYHFNAKTTPDGEHILFGGGANNTSVLDTIDCYDKSLTRTLPTTLSQARCDLAVANTGGYVLFAGGGNGLYGTTGYNTVDYYNASLSRGKTTLSQKKFEHAGASIGDYALFAGGTNSPSSGTYSKTIEHFNSSLTKGVTSTTLYATASCLAGCSTPKYAFFAGGWNRAYIHEQVIAFNDSLTAFRPSDYAIARYSLGGAFVGDYTLFAGGVGVGENLVSAVDAYNSSLTLVTAPALTSARYNYTSISTPGFAIFCGGAETAAGGDTAVFGSIDAYDASLTRTTPQNLTVARYNMAGDAINGFALFGGGTSINVTGNGTSGSAFDQVEVYQYPT